MTDEEHLEEVDFLLESMARTQPQIDRAYDTLYAAAEAFLAEVERNSNSPRLSTMRQTVEKADRALETYLETQRKNMNSLQDAIDRWKSPGRAYARLKDDAWYLARGYIAWSQEQVDSVDELLRQIEAIDAASRSR